MSNDNMTQAEVQPGGRVRLGDLLPPCPFCGHSHFDQWPCEYIDASGANVVRCAHCHAAAPMKVWHTLSAHPSPGGQDALATARELLAAEYDKAGERVFADRARKGHYDNDPDVHAIVAALAARQPVPATVKDSLTVGGGEAIGND